jgi:hypothetical protein
MNCGICEKPAFDALVHLRVHPWMQGKIVVK